MEYWDDWGDLLYHNAKSVLSVLFPQFLEILEVTYYMATYGESLEILIAVWGGYN